MENFDFLDFGYNDVRWEDFLVVLVDLECYIDDIINFVWEFFDKLEIWLDDFEVFIEKFLLVGDDVSVLKGIYVIEFFKDKIIGVLFEYV